MKTPVRYLGLEAFVLNMAPAGDYSREQIRYRNKASNNDSGGKNALK